MSSQRKLRYCLAIVVALLGLPQPLVFAESPTELNQISTEKSPRLTNIGANDFFVNGRQSSTVTNSQGFYTSLPFKSDTTRTVKWEMRVNKSDLCSGSIIRSDNLSCRKRLEACQSMPPIITYWGVFLVLYIGVAFSYIE